MSKGRSSPEVVRFLSSFTQLKEWTDDDPSTLEEFAKEDSSVYELCNKVLNAALHFEEHEKRTFLPALSAPTSTDFISQWRDYEERYAQILKEILWGDLVRDLVEADGGESQTGRVFKSDTTWKDTDQSASERVSYIDALIELARGVIEEYDENLIERFCRLDEDIPPVSWLMVLEESLEKWEEFKSGPGQDLVGIYRRKKMAPFYLVPASVSDRHDNSSKPSLLSNLQEANQAFIFGTNAAAIAMMRSVLEVALRDFYKVRGKNLKERIQNSRGRLPASANPEALQRLRILANSILHVDSKEAGSIQIFDPIRREKEVASLLHVLRDLVEAVDAKSRR